MDPQSYMLHTLILVGHAQYVIHYLFKIENFMKGIITYYFQDKCLKYHATFHCETSKYLSYTKIP